MSQTTYTGVIPYEQSLTEGRRIERWLVLAALACAALGALVGFEVALAAAALVTGILLLAPHFTTCLSLLLVMTLGISQKYIVDYRIGGEEMGGPPISALDLGMVLLAISALYHWVLNRPRNRISATLGVPLVLFSLAVTLSTVMGLGAGMGMRPVLQDLRIQAYILVSIVGAALFITRREQVLQIARTFVAIGVLLVVQQVGVFLAAFATTTEVNAVRDMLLATVLCVLTALIVLVFHVQERDVVGPAWRIPLLVGCAVAVLLSFGRSTWAVAVLSPLVLLYLARDINARARARLTQLMVAGAVLVVALAVMGPLRNMTAQRMDIVESGQIQDTATLSRLLDLEQAWTAFQSSPILGTGLGLEYNTQPTLGQVVVTNFLHNTPLYYASKMGLVGLFLVLWLYVAGTVPLYRAALQRGTMSAAMARAVFAFFVVFGPIGTLSGNLNTAMVGPMVGAFIGTPWLLLHQRELEETDESPSTAG